MNLCAGEVKGIAGIKAVCFGASIQLNSSVDDPRLLTQAKTAFDFNSLTARAKNPFDHYIQILLLLEVGQLKRVFHQFKCVLQFYC